jgi:hypothetical protein
MPADRMQGDAWREPCRAVVEFGALRKIEPHHPDHVFDLERTGEKRMAHVAADRVVQFHLLQVELRVGKPVKIADVVVDCESAAAVRAYDSHL